MVEKEKTTTQQYHHLEGRVASVETGLQNMWHTLESFQSENKADLNEIKTSINKLSDRNRLDGSVLLAIVFGTFTVISSLAYGSSLYVENIVEPTRSDIRAANHLIQMNADRLKEHENLEGHITSRTTLVKVESKIDILNRRLDVLEVNKE